MGLTPTQLLFQLCTGVDPNSLYLGGKSNPNGRNEFFLFMRLRKELNWRSSAINWNEATNRYNKDGTLSIPNFAIKDPRAIRSALKDVEDKILKRIATDNYKCKSTFQFVNHLLTATYNSSKRRRGVLEDALQCG
jgi:hypothetical protein